MWPLAATVFSDALWDRVGVWLSKNGFGFTTAAADGGATSATGSVLTVSAEATRPAGCLSVRAATSWTTSGWASDLVGLLGVHFGRPRRRRRPRVARWRPIRPWQWLPPRPRSPNPAALRRRLGRRRLVRRLRLRARPRIGVRLRLPVVFAGAGEPSECWAAASEPPVADSVPSAHAVPAPAVSRYRPQGERQSADPSDVAGGLARPRGPSNGWRIIHGALTNWAPCRSTEAVSLIGHSCQAQLTPKVCPPWRFPPRRDVRFRRTFARSTRQFVDLGILTA